MEKKKILCTKDSFFFLSLLEEQMEDLSLFRVNAAAGFTKAEQTATPPKSPVFNRNFKYRLASSRVRN